MEHWQITENKVRAAIQRIVEISHPVSVILFGSYVRGKIGPNSDIDILVVVDNSIEHCRRESVRIRKALRGISMPMDILVVRQRDLEKFARTPGLVYMNALIEGKLVYEKVA